MFFISAPRNFACRSLGPHPLDPPQPIRSSLLPSLLFCPFYFSFTIVSSFHYCLYFILHTSYFIFLPCASRQNRVFITRQTACLILYEYSPQSQLPVRLFDRRYIDTSFHPNPYSAVSYHFPFYKTRPPTPIAALGGLADNQSPSLCSTTCNPTPMNPYC